MLGGWLSMAAMICPVEAFMGRQAEATTWRLAGAAWGAGLAWAAAAIAVPLQAGGATVSPATASAVSVNEPRDRMMHLPLRGAKPRVRPS
jgi:hypothetical protein